MNTEQFMLKIATRDRSVDVLRSMLRMTKKAADDPVSTAANIVNSIAQSQIAKSKDELRQMQGERDEARNERDRAQEQVSDLSQKNRSLGTSGRTKSTILGAAAGGVGADIYAQAKKPGMKFFTNRADRLGIGNNYMEPMKWFNQQNGAAVGNLQLNESQLQTLKNLVGEQNLLNYVNKVDTSITRPFQALDPSGAAQNVFWVPDPKNPGKFLTSSTEITTVPVDVRNPAFGQKNQPSRITVDAPAIGRQAMAPTETKTTYHMPASSANSLNAQGAAQRQKYINNRLNAVRAGIDTVGAIGGGLAGFGLDQLIHGDDW